MVSLLKLARITEEGVKFQSPFGGMLSNPWHNSVNHRGFDFQMANLC